MNYKSKSMKECAEVMKAIEDDQEEIKTLTEQRDRFARFGVDLYQSVIPSSLDSEDRLRTWDEMRKVLRK